QAEACRWWGETQGYETLSRHLATLLDQIVDPGTIIAAHAGLKPAPERVQDAWSALPAVRKFRAERADLRAALKDVGSVIAGQRRPTRGLADFGERAGRLLLALEASGRGDDEAALRLLREALLTQDGEPRKQGLAAVMGRIVPVQESWGPVLREFAFDFDAEVCAAEAADRIARLLGPVHEEYLRLCQEEKRFDFLTLARR